MVINDRNDYRAHGHILYRMPLPGVPEKKREKKGAGGGGGTVAVTMAAFWVEYLCLEPGNFVSSHAFLREPCV